ncbi:MAG: tRNA (N6-threonylcarbamoyladenosine(37)-N6)-methyltransferase TrmO [Lentisphaeria bacterium]|nr:tRNA (N6-threonylcarbamoyladenosine(37)-N6)-methyltransferase TrmO [Lentisphaeria bacterium]
MTFEITPIGTLHCDEWFRFETPRQGVFAENRGYIELTDNTYAEAAADLNGFDRIWVIFVFHLNQTWNVKVTPPVAPPGRKIGVLATRSPHRPNRIGMSCVQLEKVEGRRVYIRNFDLLDKTPVIDIKPYIPAADAFPVSRTGWLEEAEANRYNVTFTPDAEMICSEILSDTGTDLQNICRVQLSYSPLDSSRKKLKRLEENRWQILIRNYCIDFVIDPNLQEICVTGITKK